MRTFCVSGLVLASGLLVAQAQAQAQESSRSDSFFGLTSMHEIHLSVAAKEWEKLQPPDDTDWDIGRAFRMINRDAEAGRHFHSDRSTRPGLAGYLGVDHQYGKADIAIDGEHVREIGLRYKGNGTFLEGLKHDKFSFKVDFNEFHDDQEFRGLAKFNLQSNVTDDSMLREALSYEVFRDAGIPCPRLSWAEVKLTVPGHFENEDMGIYSIVEQVDKRFLRNRFGTAKGLLLKPSTFGTFRYFDENWEEYETALNPKTQPTARQKKRVIEFARLVNLADRETFESEIGEHLDVDEFTRFLTVNVLLSNLDSFLGGAQNYYVYLDPRTDRFQIWPWDMDHSFGTFILVGTPETRRDLSIEEPHWGSNRIIERLMQMPSFREQYHHYLATFLDTIFDKERMRTRIAEVSTFLRPSISGRRALARFDRLVANQPSGKDPHALNLFVGERHASVKRQLANESDGKVLQSMTTPDFSEFIPAVVLGVLVLAANLCLFIWGASVGFRGSVGWGFLNLLTYPVGPIIFGFFIRPDLGRRQAFATCAMIFTVAIVIVWMMK